ncbi:hypothetical protein TSOC_011394 [Tetrabaena socialis]|uniref:Uncharacterized protein n=1 Tax=Tetrabaena socialis TaxID=47790 RepID=A0A2J7ZQR5_9CHLO|nr:hypothetical protein TSOC_011394 [Tetrabaena socialis]|eukprot:PNH02615.1 hypothetical protein TSOC_011394 [Tetrabaena socialis]
MRRVSPPHDHCPHIAGCDAAHGPSRRTAAADLALVNAARGVLRPTRPPAATAVGLGRESAASGHWLPAHPGRGLLAGVGGNNFPWCQCVSYDCLCSPYRVALRGTELE